jgi:hypothetical protein
MHDTKKCLYETRKHQEWVNYLMTKVNLEMMERAKNHDKTKLEEPELSIFVKYTPKLKDATYGSDEYKQFLAEMKPALDHHYANNRHHPEYFPDGIKGMNLVDLVELICDWTASAKRHEDGNIYRSININKERFNMSDDLVALLKNTVKDIFGIEEGENNNE